MKKWLPAIFGAILAMLLTIGAITWMESISKVPPGQVPPPMPVQTVAQAPVAQASAPVAGAPAPEISATMAPVAAATPAAVASDVAVMASVAPMVSAAAPATPQLDLSTNPDGLSKVTVAMDTTAGMIKFKFYSQDAPTTVKRVAELIQSGFYNGLMFHRVVPGFIVQGGDPTSTGTGGSGQKLKAEFNPRHHVEGTIAMARTSDPDSADSQFYIALGPQPTLDHNYTIFAQVIDGLPAIHQIKVGDKIKSMTIEK